MIRRGINRLIGRVPDRLSNDAAQIVKLAVCVVRRFTAPLIVLDEVGSPADVAIHNSRGRLNEVMHYLDALHTRCIPVAAASIAARAA